MPFSSQIDTLLDTLTSGTAEEVETALDTYTMRDIVGVLAQRLLDVEESGGGGSRPFNYAVVQFDIPPPLTVADFQYTFQTADMTITEQTGTDFSIGEPIGGQPGIVSAAGGVFQAGIFFDAPRDATLDAGSTALRWLRFAASTGDPSSTPGGLGLDVAVPVYDNGNGFLAPASCVASLPGASNPGGYAVASMTVSLAEGFGTDSVPLDLVFDAPYMVVWRIGT